MKIRVIDFESTGLPDTGQKHGVVEVGFSDLDDAGRISKPRAVLTNPKILIPPEARAVHHISDEMLIGAIDPGTAFRDLMAGMEPGDMFAAHNIEMERAFFAGGAFPWICTMKCAKHLWDDAPSYSNQALRYWLNMEEEFEWPELTHPTHRAGPDAYVTAHILGRMLLMKNPGTLVELTNTPVLLKTVGFSKEHKGKLWSEVDPGFLQWVLDKDFDAETKHTARHWLNKARGLTGTPFA